jgi:hypothetical protein
VAPFFGQIGSDSVDGLVLTVAYTWAANQTDLDTGTYFLGQAQGYSCTPANGTYLTFTGDNSGAAGSENYTIALGRAWTDGKWSESTTVQLRAGWYGSTDKGKATMTMFTRRVLVNGTTINDNNVISLIVDPHAAISGCAPQIGTATVVRGLDGKVNITAANF